MTAVIEKVCSASDKHEGDVSSLIFKDGKLFSGGADGKLKIFDENLNLIKEIQVHEAYIYAIAMDAGKRIFTSSVDGSIRIVESPLTSDESTEMMRCDNEIECIIGAGEDIISGDDKGFVTFWTNGRLKCKYNLVEQVKSIAVEKNWVYTVRSLDVVITEISEGVSDKYATKMTIEGKSPVILFGPTLDNGRKAYIGFATRSGRGLNIHRNDPKRSFEKVWSQEDLHEMIINSLSGTDDRLYSGGFDGMVKRWTGIDGEAREAGQISIGHHNCINVLCNGAKNCVYSGSSDGFIRKIVFSEV